MSEMTIFGLERLEDRMLLAVNINQSGQNLTITGDGNDEIISVYDGDFGSVVVAFDENGDDVFDDFEVFYGVKNITIKTNGGDDLVTASNLTLPGSLNIDTGSGDDFVYLGYYADAFSYLNYGEVIISGSVSINTGDGDDEVFPGSGVAISKALTINTGDGYDEVYLFSFYGFDLSVSGTTTINTGNHDDFVAVAALDDYDADVHLKNLNINTGNGDDEVFINADGNGGSGGDVEIHGNTSISTGDGDDFVYIYGYGGEGGANVDFDGSLTINTGNDDDLVVFEGEVDVHRAANIDLGSGDDVFAAFGAEGFGYGSVDFFRKFSLNAQDGDDDVYASEDVYFHQAAKFDGGNGYDEIDVADAHFYGGLTIKKFEFIA